MTEFNYNDLINLYYAVKNFLKIKGLSETEIKEYTELKNKILLIKKNMS